MLAFDEDGDDKEEGEGAVGVGGMPTSAPPAGNAAAASGVMGEANEEKPLESDTAASTDTGLLPSTEEVIDLETPS